MIGLMKVIQLTINGAPEQVDAHSTLAQLLEKMNLVGKRVAIERNGEIVPRSEYAQTELQENDQLEIVVAVGGG